MPSFPKITPCLWFDSQAEEAANFYSTVFENSRIVRILRYGEAGREIHGKPAGSVMMVEFELACQRFTALNGGPQFKFTEAVSLEVACATPLSDLSPRWPSSMIRMWVWALRRRPAPATGRMQSRR